MERAVVTGATGLVGRWVTAELLKHQIKVYALIRSRETAEQVFRSHPGLELVEYDDSANIPLRDLVPEGADVFYHFAWSGVSGEKLGDYPSQAANMERTLRFAQQLGDIGVKKFIGAGSLHEAEFLEEIRKQDAPVRMGVMYSCAKLAAHYMAKAVVCGQGIEFYWPVITNTFGVGEHTPRLVNATVRKLLAGESPQFTAGNQLYDFIYVTDAARAFRLIGEKGVSGRDYVLGSGRCRPLKEFLQCIGSIVNPKVPLLFGEAPFAGVMLAPDCFDTGSLARDTGFRCEVSFEEGITSMKQWMMEGEKHVPV